MEVTQFRRKFGSILSQLGDLQSALSAFISTGIAGIGPNWRISPHQCKARPNLIN